MKSKFGSKKSKGFTLIEFMISMVIGFVVVAAVIISFLGSGRATRYQSAISQMNQDAQIALNLLAREVQMAGYISPGQTLGAPAVFGCDGTAGAVPFTSPASTSSVSCGAATGTTVSALEVVYEADTYTTVKVGVSSTLPSDCLNSQAPASGSIYIVRNRFYIDSGTSGRPELYCASNTGNTPQPLVENVDDMQLWYGVAASAFPNQVIRYAKAGKDVTTLGTVNAQGASEWNNVNSVRICLLMRSSEPILTGEDSRGYSDCNGSSQTSTDNYLRRAYFTTATIRTKMVP